MTAMKNYGLGGVSSTVQYGKGGGHLKWDTDHFEAKNTANSAFVEVKVATPTTADSAAHKQYVDDQISQYIQGLDVKKSVHVATTGNITLSGLQTIDGISVTAGMRVLVKDQTDQKENGIYDAASGAWSRSTDADNTPYNEVSGGMFTFVEDGSLNKDTGWVLSSPEGIASLGVSSLVFTQFSSAGTYTGGAGITLSGTTLSLDIASGSALSLVGAGDAAQLDIVGTTNKVLVGSGSSSAFSYLGSLRDSSGGISFESAAGAGTITSWLKTTSADASGTVTLEVTGSGAGSTNTDLLISPAGTGLILAPSGYSMSSGPDSALATKGYVDSAVESGNWIIKDADGATYVKAASNSTDSALDKVVIGTGTQGSQAIAEFVGASSSPNYFKFSSATSTNEEVRIEAHNTSLSGDVDIRLVPQGSGQVFIGDVGNGVIQADNTYSLSLLGGDGIGGDAGDLIVSGGAGGSNVGGDVLIRQASGSTNGTVQIQDYNTSKIMTFGGASGANSFFDVTNGTDNATIASNGSGANVDLTLDPKGTGQILAGTGYVPTASLSLVTKDYVDTAVSANNQWNLGGDTGSAVVDSSDTLTFIGGTNIGTIAAEAVSGSPTLTINLDPSISLAGSVTAGTGVTATTGNITASSGNVSASGTVTAGTGLTVTTGGASITGNSSVDGTFTVNSGLATFNGGATVANGQTFTANGDVVLGNASTDSITLGGSIVDGFTIKDVANDGQTVIATDGTGANIDLVLDPKGTGFVMAPSGYSLTGASGTAFTTKDYVDAAVSGSNQWNLAGDSGSAVVDSTDTLTVVGGTNINTVAAEVVSGSPTLTVNLDPSISLAGSLTTGTTIVAGTGLTVTTGGANITGNSTVTGTLHVTSTTQLDGALDVNSTIDANDTINIVDADNSGSVTLAATGTGTNVDIVLDPKGTGVVMAPSGYSLTGAAGTAFTTKDYVDTAITNNTDMLTFRASVGTSGSTLGTMPNIAGKDYFISRVVVRVTTPFSGGAEATVASTSATEASSSTGDFDLQTAGVYYIEGNWATNHDGLAIDWAVTGSPAAGAAIVTVEYKAVSGT
jgi:hypothetical protein